jgi:hypothetical protein
LPWAVLGQPFRLKIPVALPQCGFLETVALLVQFRGR